MPSVDHPRLARFLADPARPAHTLRYHELQGFLFAVASAPEVIPPSEWRRCCMKTLRWGGLARISHDPPQDPHYRDEVEGPSHI